MVSPSTVFLEDKKDSFMGTNVSEITVTGSENYPIYWHVISYQDFSAVFIQMTVVYGVFHSL